MRDYHLKHISDRVAATCEHDSACSLMFFPDCV